MLEAVFVRRKRDAVRSIPDANVEGEGYNCHAYVAVVKELWFYTAGYCLVWYSTVLHTDVPTQVRVYA